MRAPMAVVLVLVLLGAAPGAEQPLGFETLDGAATALEAPQQGRALVLHFWATWCPSCASELAVLDRAARGCGPAVRVVAVNVAEEPAVIRAALASNPLELLVLRDPEARVFRRSGAREVPANLVWRDGAQRLEPGARDAAAWRRRLAELGC